MITHKNEICAEVLYELNISREDILKSQDIFSSYSRLTDILSSPEIPRSEKYNAIDKLFPESIRSFIKVITDGNRISDINGIFEAYAEKSGILRAELFYVTKPDDEIIEGFRKTLCKKYKSDNIELILHKDSSLIGGYRLKAGDTVYDRSFISAIKSMKNILVRKEA